MKIENLKIEDLKPYEKNPRKNDEAVKYVAESIKNFGFKVPIIIDKDNVIVAGHTRYKAAKQLGLVEVPCIIADDLSDEQVKAFRLADNKVSEKAEWDFELLEQELAEIIDINMDDLGFIEMDTDEFVEVEEEEGEDQENPYTSKVDIPQYQITGAEPKIEELVDATKARELVEEIKKANITDEQKNFLIRAAQRHLVFNYKNIAEYYAHQSEEMQNLMEKSALVIIDFEDAIKYGYTNLKKQLDKMQGLEGDANE